MQGIHYILVCLALACYQNASAQWQRVVDPFPYFWNINAGSTGSGVSFFDVDEDGWDDLTVTSYQQPTQYYRNNQGVFELTWQFPNAGDGKSCVWADLENDGDNDLLVSGLFQEVQIYLNEGDSMFIAAPAMMPVINNAPKKYYGLALGDVNRDAFLDLVIANYASNQSNLLLLNEQGDHFVNTTPTSFLPNTNTSFQPVFSDHDHDGYPELFFCNDHLDGNEYYIQDSAGIYTDQSVSSGLQQPAFAMSAAWGDVDNDQDLDLFCSNSAMNAYLLMTNQGNHNFIDYELADLVFNLEGWGSLWIDAENDGTQDMFICSRGDWNSPEGNNIYMFNDHGHLWDVEIPGMTDQAWGFFSNAKGDFNQDGLYDIAATPEFVESLHIFQNTSNSTNHFFKFKLNGRFSNRNGFGSHYTCYAGDLIQYGYTQCGDNFLAQNSQNIIVGLGAHDGVDSLVVEWPSGIVDRWYQLSADQFIQLVEGESLSPLEVVVDPCGIDPNVAYVHGPFDSIAWSTGSTSVDSVLFEGEEIAVTLSTGFGRSVNLEASIPPHENPVFNSVVYNPPCSAQSGHVAWHWELSEANLSMDTLLEVFAGWNDWTVTTPLGCEYIDTVWINPSYELSVGAVHAQPICQNAMTGGVEVVVNTQFANGTLEQTNYLVAGLSSGWQSGIIQDAQQCPVHWEAFIPQTSSSIFVTQPLCSSDSTGSILVTYASGMDDSTLVAAHWIDLPIGHYSASMETMPDGCPFAWEYELTPVEQMELTAIAPQNICASDSFQLQIDGLSAASIQSWVGPHDGEWLTSGSFNIEVMSAMGCSYFTSFEVEPFDAMEATYWVHWDDGGYEIHVEPMTDIITCSWEDGTTGFHHVVSAPGTYSCILSDAHGCSTAMVVEVNASQVEEMNPMLFHIQEGEVRWNLPSNTQVRLYSSNGQLIKDEQVGADQTSWSLKSGIYLAQLNAEMTFRFYVP